PVEVAHHRVASGARRREPLGGPLRRLRGLDRHVGGRRKDALGAIVLGAALRQGERARRRELRQVLSDGLDSTRGHVSPSSSAIAGNTTDCARRRSSAKSTSVHGSPVTPTASTRCRATSRCSASSYSQPPWLSSMTCSSRPISSRPAGGPHLKKPIPSPTRSHAPGTTFLPSAMTRPPCT